MDKQIILASQSPRRKELLEDIGLHFIICPSDFEEITEGLEAKEMALHNAIGKAQSVAKHNRNSIVIGVDTVVAFQEHILGKPKDEEDAKRILRLLSNTTHKVISAICVIDTDSKKMITSTETTLVTMDRLEEDDIDAYIKHGEGKDKAAGYAIQGIGSLFITRIEGDYFNVVGLPIYRLRKILKEFGLKKLI